MDVYLIGIYLVGVCLMGLYFTGMYLMSVYLISVIGMRIFEQGLLNATELHLGIFGLYPAGFGLQQALAGLSRP
jgi:hypothetical protein